jgi:hypothetical protein
MKRNRTMAVLPLLLISRAVLAQSACSPLVPDDVCLMEHLIYEQTDFRKTEDVRRDMVGLKNLLIAHDGDSSTIKEHILGLTGHVIAESNEVRAPHDIISQADGQPTLFGVMAQLEAYEKANGPIVPLDWTVPQGMHLLSFNASREYDAESDRTFYQASFYMPLEQAGIIEQVQLIRYPNQIIVDKQAGIGNWGEEINLGIPCATLSTRRTSPIEDGLYLLNLQVHGQPRVNGWFILSQSASSATPIVRSPTPHEVFRTGLPTFRWVDFKSPEYRPFELRKRMISTYGNNSPTGVAQQWSKNSTNPDASESITPDPALTAGNYSFHLGFQERWFLGGMLLGRSSATRVNFSIGK